MKNPKEVIKNQNPENKESKQDPNMVRTARKDQPRKSEDRSIKDEFHVDQNSDPIVGKSQ